MAPIWELGWSRPWASITKNIGTASAAVILGRHKEYFVKSNVWCPNTAKYEQKYMCPVEYVEFVQL